MTQVLTLVLLAAILCLFFVKRERVRWRIFLETSLLVLVITMCFDLSSETVALEDYARPAIIVLLFMLLYLRYQAWVKRAKSLKPPETNQETQPQPVPTESPSR
ncbi:MAG TPA: hypothetical protein PKH07_14160 [bacterium]|nr:hypothetical protein [bacterium]